MERQPDILPTETQDQLREICSVQVSTSAISRTLRRRGFTRKKAITHPFSFHMCIFNTTMTTLPHLNISLTLVLRMKLGIRSRKPLLFCLDISPGNSMPPTHAFPASSIDWSKHSKFQQNKFRLLFPTVLSP